jgi:hypothetical protein
MAAGEEWPPAEACGRGDGAQTACMLPIRPARQQLQVAIPHRKKQGMPIRTGLYALDELCALWQQRFKIIWLPADRWVEDETALE